MAPSFALPSSRSRSTVSPPQRRHISSFEQLSAHLGNSLDPSTGETAALAASVTPHDTVILTSDGHRLPGIPLSEAQQLNVCRLSQEKLHESSNITPADVGEADTATFIPLVTNARPTPSPVNVPRAPAYTHPLFPPLPLYGPPTPLTKLQTYMFRGIAFILSACFLLWVVAGALVHGVPAACKKWYLKIFKGIDPNRDRPFYQVEFERAKQRRKEEEIWEREMLVERERAGSSTQRRRSFTGRHAEEDEERNGGQKHAKQQNRNPTIENSGQGMDGIETHQRRLRREGGKDKLVADVRYYARRVGLDVQEYKVETEDGFLINLQRVYNPEDPPLDMKDVEDGYGEPIPTFTHGRRKYPVLLIHGLLQSSGAFCANDDDSLAFFLCKSGYDVWLGNNRCGTTPTHTLLTPSDPRMWAWNIRQMGILDLPAFTNHILLRTGFPKLALVAHSQGTASTLVALAREQRPELGSKISIVCALAPAVYAGRLIEEVYFKFMEMVSPGMFRLIFGIHSFIPMMMWFHRWLPGKVYGMLGYWVFSFLFKWSDRRWDKGIRDRLFIFAPVYVSAESMRWWLGRDGFATQKCILATHSGEQMEDDKELREEEEKKDKILGRNVDEDMDFKRQDSNTSAPRPEPQADSTPTHSLEQDKLGNLGAATSDSDSEIGAPQSTGPWYNHLFPPLALWICGSDDLVDGKRFLKRLEKGREPHVRLVHKKVIEGYEHLDVLWAIDSIQQVGWEVRDVIWDVVREEMEKAEKESSGKENGKVNQKIQQGMWWRDVVVPEGVRTGIGSEEQGKVEKEKRVEDKIKAPEPVKPKAGGQRYSSLIVDI